jgi:hypothetical protein
MLWPIKNVLRTVNGFKMRL